jgi:hypothetical protein
MNETIDLICFNCKHSKIGELGCAAFPDGIPEEILHKNKHDKPIKGQINNIVFEDII